MIFFKKKKWVGILIGLCNSLITLTSYAEQDLISLFPIEHYSQSIADWIQPRDNQLLLNTEIQQKHYQIFYQHYFGTHSPWNCDYVNQLLKQPSPNSLITVEQSLITYFSNQKKPAHQIGYGENFRAYSSSWIDSIAHNINISQFNNLSYFANQRAITIDNLPARVLPTEEIHFYHYQLAGQGYPFDHLQMSALWVGTPVYIVGKTRDQEWSLVITPDYIAWVKSNGIARVNETFIDTWKTTAKNQLAAITHTHTSINDEKGQFLFSTYVGAVFPVRSIETGIKILVPVMDGDRHAIIKTALVSSAEAALMPIPVTPHQFANVMSTLINRPYGWGGMYFYNDCSAELKSLFTPFGIWLPRQSSDQVTIGKMVDYSSASLQDRLSFLKNHGRKFLSIIYIGGHSLLYIGNYTMNGSLVPMTYQNIWGLSPNPPNRRAVIGQSVFFPMLKQYPEDASLVSLAAKKFFQVSYLDQLPEESLLQAHPINLKSFMYPSLEDGLKIE